MGDGPCDMRWVRVVVRRDGWQHALLLAAMVRGRLAVLVWATIIVAGWLVGDGCRRGEHHGSELVGRCGGGR